MAYAATEGPGATELPLLTTVELTPWSPGTLRIWLRNTLHGEPSPALHSWIAARSGGLPARALAALDQLRGQDGLVSRPMTAGHWHPRCCGRLGGPADCRPRSPAWSGARRTRSRVAQLLADGRLVTLAGTGGIGKTRLSLAVAGAVARRYTEGAVFVPLAEITDPELVVAAVAQALEVTEVPGQPLLDSLLDRLADASLLLVVDNFEQVVDAGWVVAEILAAAPDVHVLVTSRQPLSIYGEQVHRLRPLPLPDLAELPERAAPAWPGRSASPPPSRCSSSGPAPSTATSRLTPETLPAVVELCRRLDGLPLAIELAAARVDEASPQTLLRQLCGHLDALGSGPRDRPERQQTLRGAIDWSYTLLAPSEQRLFIDAGGLCRGLHRGRGAGGGHGAGGVHGATSRRWPSGSRRWAARAC